MKKRIAIATLITFFLVYYFSRPDIVRFRHDSPRIVGVKDHSKGEKISKEPSDSPQTLNGFPESWDSLDFFYNHRLDTNVIRVTNVYSIGENYIVTNVQEYRTNKYWNTQEWEEFSRFKVDQQIKHLYPELAQVVEILLELPAVRQSNRLYSGVYSITFTMDNVRRRIESYLETEENERDVERSFSSQGMAMSPQVAESHRDWLRSQRIDMQKEIQEMLEVQRQALIGLYGEMPLPIFQRIMAIESGLTYKL